MLLINHEKKAIYLHIPKTAGTYIAQQLMRHYGFTSYLSTLLKRRPDHEVFCNTSQYKFVPTKTGKNNFTFYNKLYGLLVYCKTSDYINNICNMNEEKWRTYTKFCFIRNPYDRAQSGVNYISKTLKNTLSLVDYLNLNPLDVPDIEHGHVFMPQKKQIEDVDGTCGVDIIGRFENLEEDFRKILGMIGFGTILHTPTKVNVTNHTESDEIKIPVAAVKRINELFKEDFELFHYKQFCGDTPHAP